MKDIIGVVGVGDLGGQLALQLASAGFDVLTWDINPNTVISIGSGAVDSTRRLTITDLRRIEQVRSLEELKLQASIIHWAVPSRNLSDLGEIKPDTMVVLHDSVMQNSVDAFRGINDTSQFVMAHCLMNESLRVLIATDTGDIARAEQHFERMGLNADLITQNEHDTLMARTQGVFALLIELGMGEELKNAYKKGNLTPSAEELLHAVLNRESRWTPATIESILANPKLKMFASEIASALEKNHETE